MYSLSCKDLLNVVLSHNKLQMLHIFTLWLNGLGRPRSFTLYIYFNLLGIGDLPHNSKINGKGHWGEISETILFLMPDFFVKAVPISPPSHCFTFPQPPTESGPHFSQLERLGEVFCTRWVLNQCSSGFEHQYSIHLTICFWLPLHQSAETKNYMTTLVTCRYS